MGVDSTVETSTTRPRSASEIYEEMEQEAAAERQAECESVKTQVKKYVKSVSSSSESFQNKSRELKSFVTEIGVIANASFAGAEVSGKTLGSNDELDADKHTFVPDNQTLKEYGDMVAANEEAGRKTKTLKYTDEQVDNMSILDIPRALNSGLISNPGCQGVQAYFKNVAAAAIGPVSISPSTDISNFKTLADMGKSDKSLANDSVKTESDKANDLKDAYENAAEAAREDTRSADVNDGSQFVTQHETAAERDARRGQLAGSIVKSDNQPQYGEREFF